MRALAHRFMVAIKTNPVGLTRRVFNNLTSRFITINEIIFYKKDINTSFPTNTSTPSTFRIRSIIDDSSVAFQALMERFPEKSFSSRLERAGSQCFVTYFDNRIVGYAWVAVKDCYIAEIEHLYKLDLDAIYIYDCFVCEEFRGKGIYPSMILAAVSANSLCVGQSRGVRQAYICVEAANNASIEGIRKAGFRAVNRVLFLKWGNFRRWWWQH